MPVSRSELKLNLMDHTCITVIGIYVSVAKLSFGMVICRFLYPTSYDYNATLKNSMFFYEANMVGNLPPSITSSIPWRGSAMTGDLTPIGTDLTGGWLTGDAASAYLSLSDLPGCT